MSNAKSLFLYKVRRFGEVVKPKSPRIKAGDFFYMSKRSAEVLSSPGPEKGKKSHGHGIMHGLTRRALTVLAGQREFLPSDRSVNNLMNGTPVDTSPAPTTDTLTHNQRQGRNLQVIEGSRPRDPLVFSLDMFAPGSLKSGVIDPHVDTFYNKRARTVLATHTYPSFRDREARKRQQYEDTHPEADMSRYGEQRARTLQKLEDLAIKRVNRHNQVNLGRHFGISSLDKYRGDAKATIYEVGGTVLPGSDIYKLREETSTVTESPADIVVKVIKAQAKGDEELVDEIIRQEGLAVLAAEHNTYHPAEETEERLNRINDVLTDHLFGVPQLVNYWIECNNRTNKVVAYGEDKKDGTVADPQSSKTHIKSIERRMRVVFDEDDLDENGNPKPFRKKDGTELRVYFTTNKKEMPAVLGKAFRDAVKRRDVLGGSNLITPEVDVNDYGRWRVVVDSDDDDDLTRVRQQVNKILWKYEQSLAPTNAQERPDHRFKEGISDIVDKPRHRDDPTQSEYIRFERDMVIYEGGDPIEAMYWTFRDYLMNKYYIGKYNQKLDKQEGGGHPVYEVLRAETIFNDLIHPETSGYDGNLHVEARRTVKGVMKQLLQKDRRTTS